MPSNHPIHYPIWLKTGASSRTGHYFVSRHLTICGLRNSFTTSLSHGVKPKPCPLCLKKLFLLSSTQSGSAQSDIDKSWADSFAHHLPDGPVNTNLPDGPVNND